MTTNKQCNHAFEIARDFYAVVSEDNGDGWKPWEELTDPQRAAFVRLAQRVLPISGKHALEDVRIYLTGQGMKTTLFPLPRPAPCIMRDAP